MLRPDFQVLSFANVQDRVAHRSTARVNAMGLLHMHVCIRQSAPDSPSLRVRPSARQDHLGKALLREWVSAVKNS